MKVHLLDGTYELFRYHYGIPRSSTPKPPSADEAANNGSTSNGNANDRGAGEEGEEGEEVAATRGVMWSVIGLLQQGVTHLGVATDHVIESFRNVLWPTYKSSVGMPPELLSQFPLLEEALEALGVVVWPMVDLEADDALAAAAATAASDAAVDQVVIMTPDKDLAQCVVGKRVVQLVRRTDTVVDEEGVLRIYGVAPESIPDWLALVGDSSDGYPGLKGWGKKAASTVLRRYRHIEYIPDNHFRWDVDVRGSMRLASSLNEQRELAFLFRDLATLRSGAGVVDDVEQLRWRCPTERFAAVAARLRAPTMAEKAQALSR